METNRPPQHTAPRRDDSRLPLGHSTRHGVGTATQGQVHGPWKRYQLKVDNGRFMLPGNGDDDDEGEVKRSTLDPETRAGCVPATAYPSFRTMPQHPAVVATNRRSSPRVSNDRFSGYHTVKPVLPFQYINCNALSSPEMKCMKKCCLYPLSQYLWFLPLRL